MTSGAPWSVKGIDPKAREVAKDLARRSGMTLGEWLNRMILEDEGPEELTSQEQFADPRAFDRPDYAAGRYQAHRDPADAPTSNNDQQRVRISPEVVADRIVRAARDPGAPRSHYERLGERRPYRVEAPLHPSDELPRVLAAIDRISERIADAEDRASHAISSVELSVRAALDRIEAGERDQIAVAARFEGVTDELKTGHAQLADRLRKYETDGSGPRSAEALHALEQALGKVASRLYAGESQTQEILGAVEARVQRLEANSNGNPADFADEVLGRIGERLAEAQTKTSEALEGLRASFADLDGRLGAVESSAETPPELRLEDLAASLTSRMEAARVEFAEKLGATVDDHVQGVESRLADMAQHVTAAEQRSTQAIEQIGRDVLAVADSLTRKLQASDQRAADEMSRIATTVETRLGRSESVHADALERLSGEITRITERLGERITVAERRSGQAVDEMAEKVARVTEKITLKQERAAEDLAERIRHSEERTAKLLEEGREKLDQRLADLHRRSEAPTAAGPPPHDRYAGYASSAELGPPEPDRRSLESAFAIEPLDAFPASAPLATDAEPGFDDVDFDAADGFAPAAPQSKAPEPAFAISPSKSPAEAPLVQMEDEEDSFSADTDFLSPAGPSAAQRDAAGGESYPDPFAEIETPASQADAEFEADDFLDPLAELEPDSEDGPDSGDEQVDEDLFAPVSNESARPLTTREIIEQARLAARSSTASATERARLEKQRAEAARAADAARAPQSAAPKSTMESSESSMFSGFGGAKRKKRSVGGLQTALLIAGGAAFLSVGAAGLVVMGAKPGGDASGRVAEGVDAESHAKAVSENDRGPFGQKPRASIAVAPQGFNTGAAPVGTDTPQVDLAANYDAAIQSISAREPGALDALRKTADQGYAPAQLYLASLYESGGAGLKKDIAEARRWTELAARGGDRKAMHNFALYAFEGAGGQPKNPALAAQWFRKAGDLGLVDSQYNLGRLYEQGLGVAKNSAEALKWYLIAARSGDQESLSSAARVRTRLSVDTQLVAERAAAGFRSTAVASTTPASVPTMQSTDVVTAQRALSRLGYYQGPRDGVTSPALSMAIAAYQREQGIPPTGTLDTATVGKLEVFTR